MINAKKVYLFALVLSVGFLLAACNKAHAKDPGVLIGVTILSVGPPTINDFDYSGVNNINPDQGGTVKSAQTSAYGSSLSGFFSRCLQFIRKIF